MAKTAVFAPTEKPIGQLINEEYAAAKAAMFSALKHAVACGEHLLTAKQECISRNENWPDWQKKNNIDMPQTTASLYMRLAQNTDEISKALANDPQLSITKAIKLLPKQRSRGATQPRTGTTGTNSAPPANHPPDNSVKEAAEEYNVNNLAEKLQNWPAADKQDLAKRLGVEPKTLADQIKAMDPEAVGDMLTVLFNKDQLKKIYVLLRESIGADLPGIVGRGPAEAEELAA
jgi:hypothetical protein